MSRANSSAHAELFSTDMLPVSAIGLRMVAAANLVEAAALVGDTARATMLNALMGGQALTATRACLLRQCLSLDGERPLDQAGCRAALDYHSQPPLQLLSDRVPAGRDDAGEHQGRRRHRGATRRQPRSANDDARTPFCPKLLRSPWLARPRPGDRGSARASSRLLIAPGGSNRQLSAKWRPV